MGQTGQTEAYLRHLQPLTLAHQHPVIIERHAIKNQFTMTAMFFWPHNADTPFNPPAGIIPVKQKGGETVARITAGFGNQNEMSGLARTGDVPFAAIDHPFAIVPGGGRLDHPRVRATAWCRFGHGKRRPYITINNGLQPCGLLLVGSDLIQNIHIAVIRRRTIKRNRAEN